VKSSCKRCSSCVDWRKHKRSSNLSHQLNILMHLKCEKIGINLTHLSSAPCLSNCYGNRFGHPKSKVSRSWAKQSVKHILIAIQCTVRDGKYEVELCSLQNVICLTWSFWGCLQARSSHKYQVAKKHKIGWHFIPFAWYDHLKVFYKPFSYIEVTGAGNFDQKAHPSMDRYMAKL